MTGKKFNNELWYDVIGYEDYQWSNRNRVRSYRPLGGRGPKPLVPRILSSTPDKDGYLLYRISKKPGLKHDGVFLHQMVATYFYGPSNGRLVRHLDGNPSNNDPSNLLYGTAKDNTDDRLIHGKTVFGEKIHTAKLNETQVKVIRSKYSQGFSIASLAIEYKVSEHAIHCIVREKTWRHIL